MKRINERYNKEVELSELKELCKNKREIRQERYMTNTLCHTQWYRPLSVSCVATIADVKATLIMVQMFHIHLGCAYYILVAPSTLAIKLCLQEHTIFISSPVGSLCHTRGFVRRPSSVVRRVSSVSTITTRNN